MPEFWRAVSMLDPIIGTHRATNKEISVVKSSCLIHSFEWEWPMQFYLFCPFCKRHFANHVQDMQLFAQMYVIIIYGYVAQNSATQIISLIAFNVHDVVRAAWDVC